MHDKTKTYLISILRFVIFPNPKKISRDAYLSNVVFHGLHCIADKIIKMFYKNLEIKRTVFKKTFCFLYN